MFERAKGFLINIDDLQEVTGIPVKPLSKYAWYLEGNGLISKLEPDEREIIISYFSWDFWHSIKGFCEISLSTLDKIIDNIDFSLLD
ncbi:hypothetical protein [Bacillus cereus]|uniref:Uncharacterized protein n=1 Tax=Bacillus cereus TaxID=1396 RepID=A0A9X6X0B1_BACCE|nr:hypothetical protein [Bacillus cereus]PFK18061.1 hypothetical protein COI98_13440 [Bacillus cereus]